MELGGSRRADDGSCASRSYLAVVATQFFGALNDNLYKLVVSYVIIDLAPTKEDAASLISLAGALFVLPYVLFSSYAGFLADRYRKSSIIKFTKLLELGIMSTGAYFFVTKNVEGLLVVLFFMGFQSMLFSPSKYGILPEQLRLDQLSKGNGYLEAATFLAIIVGTASAGPIKAASGSQMILPAVLVVVLALIGLFTCSRISPVPASGSELRFQLNPFKDIFRALCEINQSRELFLSVLAISYFWMVAAAFQLNILLYSSHVMGLDEFGTTVLLCALAIGIGAGSCAAGFVSEGKIELGLVPIGAIGISLMSFLLGFSYNSFWATVAVLAGLGFSSGLYSVPLNAFIQRESPAETRGRFIAAANFTSFTGMLLAAAFIWFCQDLLALGPEVSFVILGILSLAVTVYIVKTMPEMLARCLNWMLAHTFYRLDVQGADNIPEEGGALIVCNHVSFVDPPLLLASVERPIRFLMFRPLYEAPGLHQVAKLMKAIPISGADGKDGVLRSLAKAREYIEQGEVVGIFAEGGISRTGNMLQFRKGLETIMQGVDAPIIPAYLDQIWGSIFSYKKGKFVWKLPKRIPYRLGVSFGKPIPANSTASEVRQAVQELAADAVARRKGEDLLLHQSFVAAARRRGFSTLVENTHGRKVSGYEALASVIGAINKLDELDEECGRIALRLKPGIDSSLMLVAATASGKLPIMIPERWAAEQVMAFMREFNVDRLIADDDFDLGSDSQLALSDFMSNPTFIERVLASIKYGSIEKGKLAVSAEDPAVVVFPRTDKEPLRAVTLSHRNISFNVDALYDLYQLTKKDSVVGNLPLSHAAGVTLNVWLPLTTGMKLVFPSNGEHQAVVEAIRDRKVSTLFGTPQMLKEILEVSSPEDLKSLRHIVVGAERLEQELRDEFFDKFGIVPREGFGASELSPIALVNVPDFEHHRYPQPGDKPGTAGHPLPGVAVKVVNPETGEECRQGEEGILLIRGAGVMRGYLDQEDFTKRVIVDGWYRTRQLATVDEDGFVWLCDSKT